MKNSKYVMLLIIIFLSFSFLLSILDFIQRIDIKYPYPYRLNSNYITFSITKEEDKLLKDNLYNLVKDKELLIIKENINNIGLFDTMGKYIDDPIYFGEALSRNPEKLRDKEAMLLFDENMVDIPSSVVFNKNEYKVVGIYTRDYVGFNNKNEIIYSLFSNNQIKGKYYIECENNDLKMQIINLFLENDKSLEIETNHIGLLEIIQFSQYDRQFKMIQFVLILAFISYIITDISLIIRKKQIYKVYYLVGSNIKKIYIKECLQMAEVSIIGISIAVILYNILFSLNIYKVRIPQDALLISILFLCLIYIIIHEITFIYISKKFMKERLK